MTQATLTDAPVPAAGVGRPVPAGRWSAGVFAVAVIVAFPLFLWLGRDHWFYLDEWQILGADGESRTGYLDGHNGHWITWLRLEYRLNFELWGLRSYLPYQVPAVLGHLASAVLLRQVCRRLGTRGWIATATALAFLFFGPGRMNMTLGFQVSLTASLICWFGMLLLTYDAKAVTRRDWFALGLGVVGLMTSGLFPAILVGFGVTTLLRRGPRAATFYALPLGAIYLAWYVTYGHESAFPARFTGQAARYVRRLLWAAFDALGQGGVVAALLLALAVVGLGVALHRAWRCRLWAEAALPLGLFAAWLSFSGVTAVTRESLADLEVGGRVVHISVALVLPLVAAGAEELARRRTFLGVAALAPLAIGALQGRDQLSETSVLFRTDPELVSAIAHSPLIVDVPGNHRPLHDNGFLPPATADWLARQAAAGRIPEPDDLTTELRLTATNRLALIQAEAPSDQLACPALTAPLTVSVRTGDEIRFVGAIEVRVTEGQRRSQPRRFAALEASVVRAQAGPVDVLVRSVPDVPAWLCPPSA
ncbi:MAG: hypothetical protein ACRD07_00440 [Acidimicrobiales bacterium]